MTAARIDQSAVAITAGLLRTGRRVDTWSCCLTVLALPAAWIAADAGNVARLVLALLTLALGFCQRYLALRVEFDARLFEALARNVQLGTERMNELDDAMQALGLLPPDKTGRAWTERCAGATRLLRRQIASASLQTLVAVTAAAIGLWS